MPPGKLAIADRGYISAGRDEQAMLSTPNDLDDERVAKFKSRARARHESFNGRLKFFDILQNTFRHGEARHKIAFEAVCVIVQYQMDNGSPLFDTW
jgi:hypothetical protein